MCYINFNIKLAVLDFCLFSFKFGLACLMMYAFLCNEVLFVFNLLDVDIERYMCDTVKSNYKTPAYKELIFVPQS